MQRGLRLFPLLFLAVTRLACSSSNQTGHPGNADAETGTRPPADSGAGHAEEGGGGGDEAGPDANLGAPTGPGASSVFSYPNGFAAATNLQGTGACALSGGVLEVTSGATGNHEAGACWYKVPQKIQSFTTDFTFQPNPSGFGLTFCVQNNNATVYADSNGIGYGAYTGMAGQTPIGKSIAVKFDLTGEGQTNYLTAPNATGLYINGGPSFDTAGGFIPENDLNPSGINLHTGDIMAAHIVYDGTLLTLTLRDTVNGAAFRIGWPIDIPRVVGGDSAWVGFTSGTISPVAQDVLTWSFSEGYAPRLAEPVFSVPGGSYASARSVSIRANAGATIYYTTNGQAPTTASPKYTGPISVSASTFLQAVAVETGYTDSLVAEANYQIAPTGAPVINFPNGFAKASGLVSVNGTAVLEGSAIQLTDTANNDEAGSAWYVAPVNVQSFKTSFTVQFVDPGAAGMTFAIQNQNAVSSDSTSLCVSGGPTAVANCSGGLGYAGLLSSAAVKFDLYTGAGDSTGLYTNGAEPSTPDIDMTSSGLSLHSGNPLDVTLAYNGTTLSLTIKDTVTHASFSNAWTIDLPTTVGGNTAYVGFTAGTGGLTALQKITSWTYAN